MIRRLATLAAVALVLAGVAAPVRAERVVQEVYFSQLPEGQGPSAGTIIPSTRRRHEGIEVTNDRSEPLTVRLAVLQSPKIANRDFGVVGFVRTDAVDGKAYLEMISTFPDGSEYFSRTSGDSGPLANLEGTQARRPFLLPFHLEPGNPLPTRIALQLVMPGKGTVRLDTLCLSDYAPGDDPVALAASRFAWWTDREGGRIGTICGILIAVAGLTVGLLSSLGRARFFVLALMVLMALVGATMLAFGLMALSVEQPYAVWYPLILGGGLAAIIFGFLIPRVRRRYRDAELRKIDALDTPS